MFGQNEFESNIFVTKKTFWKHKESVDQKRKWDEKDWGLKYLRFKTILGLNQNVELFDDIADELE